MQIAKYWISILFITLGLCLTTNAQTEKPASDTTTVSQRKPGFILLPVAFFSPETNWAGGIAGMYFFRTSKTKQNHLSSVQFVATYTQLKQALAQLPYEFWLDNNQHVIRGQFTWFRYPLKFWGVGPYTPNSNEENYTTSTLRIRFNYLYKLRGKLYAGIRYRLENSNISAFEDDGILNSGTIIGDRGGVASGIGLLLNQDKRNHVLNPSEGSYAEIAFTTHAGFTGSDFNFTKLQGEYRKYIKVSDKPVFGNKTSYPTEHVFGVHAITEFNFGAPSFESLALMGNGRIMRGYYIGRYRDNNLVALQAEYRLPLYRRWGMVGFAGLGNVADNIGDLGFQEIKYSLGGGIRFKFSRKENINLRLDYARGIKGSSGIYVTVGESF